MTIVKDFWAGAWRVGLFGGVVLALTMSPTWFVQACTVAVLVLLSVVLLTWFGALVRKG